MKKRRTTRLCLLVVVATFALTAAAFGAEASKAEDNREGIEVHGHWKIEIFNPDGTRASVTEFDNALTQEGRLNLLWYLLGTLIHGSWQIQMDTNVCENLEHTGPGNCLIGEAGAGGFLVTARTLVVSVPNYVLTLSGNVVAEYDGVVNGVSTRFNSCLGEQIFQSDCKVNSNYSAGFTQATLTQPESVLAGQTIQVTVTISFS